MSIARLAKDLGLSISTVSHALNGYRDVSEQTKKRVFERATQLGYRANPSALRLKSGKSSAIGLVIPALTSGGQTLDARHSGLLGGITEEIEKAGYYLLITIATKHDPALEAAQYENFIKGSWVDAVVIMRTLVRDERVLLAQKTHIPFVTYGRTQSKIPYAWVDADNEKAFYLATRRQIEFGHRRIALLNAPPQYNFARLRQKGYERALEEIGVVPDRDLMVAGDETADCGHALAHGLLTLKAPPTAFVCTADTLALGVIAACREKNLRIGKEVSVIGFGNSDASTYCAPPITTVENNVIDSGRHLGLVLLRLLAGEPPDNLHYLRPVEIVSRGSDGPIVVG